jgi:hypothetical protein
MELELEKNSIQVSGYYDWSRDYITSDTTRPDVTTTTGRKQYIVESNAKNATTCYEEGGALVILNNISEEIEMEIVSQSKNSLVLKHNILDTSAGLLLTSQETIEVVEFHFERFK